MLAGEEIAADAVAYGVEGVVGEGSGVFVADGADGIEWVEGVVAIEQG